MGECRKCTVFPGEVICRIFFQGIMFHLHECWRFPTDGLQGWGEDSGDSYQSDAVDRWLKHIFATLISESAYLIVLINTRNI
jgi:hypothetical protein